MSSATSLLSQQSVSSPFAVKNKRVPISAHPAHVTRRTESGNSNHNTNASSNFNGAASNANHRSDGFGDHEDSNPPGDSLQTQFNIEAVEDPVDSPSSKRTINDSTAKRKRFVSH